MAGSWCKVIIKLASPGLCALHGLALGHWHEAAGEEGRATGYLVLPAQRASLLGEPALTTIMPVGRVHGHLPDAPINTFVGIEATLRVQALGQFDALCIDQG